MTTIYADNAATTQMSRAAIDAMLPYLETIYGNPSSLHSVGQQAAGALLSARDRIAKCLNASPREIYFTSGGSEADNQAILSAARLGERKGKKHIISTAFEHHAVLHTLKKLEKEGFTVPGFRHVRQQRDRLHPANQRDQCSLPRGGRAVPHRRRAGRGASAH